MCGGERCLQVVGELLCRRGAGGTRSGEAFAVLEADAYDDTRFGWHAVILTHAGLKQAFRSAGGDTPPAGWQSGHHRSSGHAPEAHDAPEGEFPMSRTVPAAAVGATLVVMLAGCSSSTPDAASDATPSDAASPASPSTSASVSASPSAPSPATSSAASVTRYVDPIPSDLRASMFQQDSVPPSFADWISTSPGQTTSDGRHDVRVDRRLPACGKDPATHFESDKHTAGFASKLFQAGDFVVARQLTVYHDEAGANAALEEIAADKSECPVYDGKPVTASVVDGLRDAAELDVPQHDRTLAGETSLFVGAATGASWWTVVSRQGKAVVLTRVVDPKADVAADGTPNDSIELRQAVLTQARISAKALDSFTR
jgi:hypothetical protein